MIALLFVFFEMSSYTQSKFDMDEVRAMYTSAAVNESACKKLITTLSDVDVKSNPIAAGYKACGMMIMAKYYLNPVSKINTFNDGKNLLAQCVEADNDEVELRFLRFAAQCETPSFLGYDDDILNDKALIIKSYSRLNDSSLKEMIRSYMLQSEQVLESEKQIFTQTK